MRNRILIMLFAILLVEGGQAQSRLIDNPQVKFAFEELAKVDKSVSVEVSIDEKLGDDSFRLEPSSSGMSVVGGDPTGVMYGVMEIAEQLSFGRKLRSIEASESHPYIANRGIKMNIPLDARTPSYDDTGDAAQCNIAVMWEWEYWQNFLDDMARNRYNLLTLWSAHPFPSMVKVAEYPEVALDDVCRYTGDITSNTNMKWIGEDIQNPDNLEVLKHITIDEKIEFWRRVFTYADDRGIDIHIYTWNVFVYGAEGKYGITWNQTNPKTVDYFRKSVKELLLTYPMIDGIGVTAGEHVNRNLTSGRYTTENWMWETYGQGIMDAKYENPEIDVRFIFRQHWSDWGVISDAFRNYDGEMESSFKYSRARMFSSTTPPWFDKIFRTPVEEHNIKSWFNVRNDDIFNFRWGDPLYANEYIKNMPRHLSPGYFVGPDGYIWGRTFNSLDEECQGGFEFRKQWYNFMIWGRAGYNPDLGDEFYINTIARKFPKANAKSIYTTWRATSEVISWVDKIFFRQNDVMFAPEACKGSDNFININRMIAIGAMPEQGVISIADYANGDLSAGDITPFDVADRLEAASNTLLSGVKKIKAGSDAELRETLVDFEAMGYLAAYYSAKVRAATHLALYRVGGSESDKAEALAYAKQSVEEWRSYADAATKAYAPQLYARSANLDWYEILELTQEDVRIVENAISDGEKLPAPDDNTLWNKELNRI